MLLRAVADDPAALSWLVASVSLLTTEDRQALLAESATRRRLAAETAAAAARAHPAAGAGRRAGAAAGVRHADDGQLTGPVLLTPRRLGASLGTGPPVGPAAGSSTATGRPARGPRRRLSPRPPVRSRPSSAT